MRTPSSPDWKPGYGARLRAARAKEQVSLAQLALACKVSKQHIADIEMDRRRPGLSLAKLLMKWMRKVEVNG